MSLTVCDKINIFFYGQRIQRGENYNRTVIHYPRILKLILPGIFVGHQAPCPQKGVLELGTLIALLMPCPLQTL